MASRPKQSNDVFMPIHKPGWRELACYGGAVLRAAPGTDAQAAGALPSRNVGADARQGVQA